MTTVFGGIDLPIFEILFIASVLLLCGLFVMILGIFYILNELRSLKKMMKKEEEQIKVFEKDIKEFENIENNSNDAKTDNDSQDDNLVKYIKENLEKGYSWEQIKPVLVKQGHKEEDIETIHDSLK